MLLHERDCLRAVEARLGALRWVVAQVRLLELLEVLLKELGEQAVLVRVPRTELLGLLKLAIVDVLADGLVESLLAHEEQDQLILHKRFVLLHLLG